MISFNIEVLGFFS